MHYDQPYLIGLDVGTTSVKAALFDTSGSQLAVCAIEYSLDKPAPDIVELDPEVYWRSACTAIADIINSNEVSIADIKGIGVTSQGETLIVLDKHGKPLRKAIVWLDNRAVSESDAIADNFSVDEVYRITGQQEIVPGWTAAKILWIKNNELDIFNNIDMLLMVSDYLIFKLTGNFVSDHGINPSTLYYDLTTGTWWNKMLDFLGIEVSQLPVLQNSGTVAGKVTADIGLGHDTVVVSAPIDQIAGAAGAGNIAPGMITETTGSALAICASCDRPVYDPRKRVGLYRHAVPDTYVLLPWVPTAGMAFRWFRDEFAPGVSYSELAEAAQKVYPGANGLTFLPHLSGAVCPEVNPHARGVFHGISLGHRREHFIRALFEAVAFILRENLEMLADLGITCDKVCSLGGGAESPLWLQIKADVLNREIVTAATSETTCLGCALLAAVGTKVYPDLNTATAEMVKFSRRFSPAQENVQKYENIYQRYLKLNKLLLPTFGESND